MVLFPMAYNGRLTTSDCPTLMLLRIIMDSEKSLKIYSKIFFLLIPKVGH